MKITTYIIGLTIAIFLFIFYSAFGDNEKKNKKYKQEIKYVKNFSTIFPKIKVLRNADIIFRRGYGVDSTVAMNFSEGEKRYSHAGIIYTENDKIYVIHAEDDEDNNRNGVFKEELHDYIDGSPVWAVYRYKFSHIIKKQIIEQALSLSKSHITFDGEFDLDDDKQMYCSEFIYKVVNRSADKEIIHAGKRFMSRTFVTISDLYENNHSELIQSSHKKIKD